VSHNLPAEQCGVDPLDETTPEQLMRTLELGLRGAVVRDARWARLPQDRRLRTYLAYARRSIPYYKRLLAGTPAPLLDDFPVISRAQVGSNPRDFISSRFSQMAEQYFAYTNRSIATILKVGFDPAEVYEINYETFNRLAKAIPDVAEAAQPGEVSIGLIADTPNSPNTSVVLIPWKASLCRRLFIGRGSRFDAQVVRYLGRSRPLVLYGRPSNLVQLADIAEEEGVRITPRAVFVSGENLFEVNRARIAQAFSHRIINAYIATEGGPIAMECGAGEGLHVLEDRVLLEVMCPNGTIAPQGTGELLLTNFSNRCSAFIRYSIGDRGTIAVGRCACGFQGATITDLPGKEETEFHFPHGVVRTGAIAAIFQRHYAEQFQVVQRAPLHLEATWIPRAADAAVVESRAIKEELDSLISPAVCSVMPVGSITKPGAKQRRFVCELAVLSNSPVERGPS
jgi:hypothetical protein